MIVDVAASGAGYAVVADALQRGWHAEVDGKVADLVPVDHAGVGVWAPAGQHRVVLRYRPPGWELGSALSASSACVLGLVLLLPRLGFRERIALRRRGPSRQ